MSDGDSATPGRPRASDSNGANEWLTRSPRPPRAAAPWERRPAVEPEDSETSPPTGSHTDGVTVADLIAKVTGSTPADLPSRHAAPEPDPSPEPEPEPAPPPTPPRAAAPPPRQPAAPPAPPPAAAAATSVQTAAARRPVRPGHRGHPSGVLRRRDPRSGGVAARTTRARRAGAGGPPVRRTHRSAEEAPSRGAGSCWRAVPWPPSSPCSRSR